MRNYLSAGNYYCCENLRNYLSTVLKTCATFCLQANTVLEACATICLRTTSLLRRCATIYLQLFLFCWKAAQLFVCRQTILSRNCATIYVQATVNPFRTAVPLWGQTIQFSSSLSPKWDCSPKGVNTAVLKTCATICLPATNYCFENLCN